VFVAPNIGGESFGIILLEAMSAGTPVVASDLDAFRRVLETADGSSAGVLAAVGDAESLALAITTVLGSDARRNLMHKAGADVVRRYDWSVVAQEIVRVYEMTIAASPEHVTEEPEPVDDNNFFETALARFNAALPSSWKRQREL
jgi:phosphatidyl-myo-inositol alpha-mannosyltransferase